MIVTFSSLPSPNASTPHRPGNPAVRGVLFVVKKTSGLGKESILHRAEHGGTACGEVDAALQITGIGRAQRAVTAQLNGTALGKAAGRHNDLVGVTRLIGGFRGDKAVDGASLLDAGAEPLQGRRTAGIKAGDNVVVLVGIAGHRVDTAQLQQALGIDGSLDRLTDYAGGVVEAKEGIPQRVLGAAQILADSRGGKPVADLLHQIGTAGNVAAGGG